MQLWGRNSWHFYDRGMVLRSYSRGCWMQWFPRSKWSLLTRTYMRGVRNQADYCVISPWCPIYASVNWVSFGSVNGLSPLRRQAIIWTNAGLYSIVLLRRIFSGVRLENLLFSLQIVHLKLLSADMAAIFSRGDELTHWGWVPHIYN